MHYLIGVVVLQGASEEQVHDALSPYDENVEVAEHDAVCHCRIMSSFEKRGELTEGLTGDDAQAALWERRASLARLAPDPTCEHCNGTGTQRSTYNERSLFDYYEIGGRWSGVWGERNRIAVAELLDQELSLPYALVLPEGLVSARAEFYVEKPAAVWVAEARSALAPYRDRDVFAVDCHK